MKSAERPKAPRTKVWLSVAMMAGALLPELPASAEEQDKFAVVPYYRSTEDKAVLDAAADKLRSVLGLMLPGKVLDRATTEQRICPLCKAALQAESNKEAGFSLSGQALRDYLNASYEEAEKKLREAEGLLLDDPAMDEERRWAELDRIWHALARLYLETNREKQALEHYSKILRRYPDAPNDEKRFSPKEREILAKLKTASSSPKAKLTVEAAGENTQVCVNGNPVGQAPIEVLLEEGVHFISARRGNCWSLLRKMQILSGPQKLFLDPDLEASVLRYRCTGFGEPVSVGHETVRRMIDSLHVSKLVLLRVKLENAEIYVSATAFDITGQAAQPEATEKLLAGQISAQGIERIARAISGAKPAHLAPAVPEKTDAFGVPARPFVALEAESSRSRFYETWWFWTTVGVAAAAAGGGIYWLARTDTRDLTIIILHRQ